MIKKFTYICRKNQFTIYECLLKKHFHGADRLLPGETFYEILEPTSLKGEVWMDWAFYDDAESVKAHLKMSNVEVKLLNG